MSDIVSINGNASGQANKVNFLSVYNAGDLSTLESDGLLGLSPKPFKYGASGRKTNLLVAQLAAN